MGTKMSLEEFKGRVATCDEYEAVDVLCLMWLKEAAADYQPANKPFIGKLLDLVEELMQ